MGKKPSLLTIPKTKKVWVKPTLLYKIPRGEESRPENQDGEGAPGGVLRGL